MNRLQEIHKQLGNLFSDDSVFNALNNSEEKVELHDDLKLYELELKQSLKSKVSLINTVVNYALKRKGKRFRPLLCILCSRLDGRPNKKTFLSAICMVHE